MKMRPALVLFAFLLSVTLCAGENNPPAFGGDYDDVIRDLVPSLAKDNVAAQDAAIKLSRIGKRAIPVLRAAAQSAGDRCATSWWP